MVCGVFMYKYGYILKDSFFLLIFFLVFLPLCFHFHSHETSFKKSPPLPPKQALRPSWGIRESAVHMVYGLVGLFSFPFQFFFGRCPRQVVLSAWSKGMALRVERRATQPVALGSVVSLSVPLLPHNPHPLGSFLLVMSQEGRSEKAAQLPGLETAAASPSCLMGFTQLRGIIFSQLQSLLPGLQSPLGAAGFAPKVWQPESSPISIQNLSKGNNYCILFYLRYFVFDVIVCFWDGKKGGCVSLVLLPVPPFPGLCDAGVMVVPGALDRQLSLWWGQIQKWVLRKFK